LPKNNVEYWSELAQRYDKVVDIVLENDIRSLLNEKLIKEDHLGKVLEFGCGTGYFTKTLVEKSDSVIASDISEEMLLIAKKRLEGLDNLEFRNEDCQMTNFVDETFDTIFSGLVLLFVEDKIKALNESHRILKPKGTLIITNPDPTLLKGFRKLKFFLRSIITYRGNLPPASFLSKKDLIDMFEETGFTVLNLEVIKDISDPSSVPAEYIKVIKS
jgi:ubiquinone/menaquinone biosynthesis C-methylase UbiE